MSTKLNDSQLVMLSAAAQRNDRCLVAPPNLMAGAARRMADKLIAAGLVRIPTKPATHSNRKPATDSDLKPAGIPI